MRFTNVVLAYFVMGAMMWGGGLIAWDNAGLGTLFVENPGGNTQVNQETADDLSKLGGPIQAAASAVSGTGLIAIWNVLVKIVGYLNWPIITLISQNAPPRVVVLVGGTPTVAFWTTFIRLVRSSA